MTPSQEIIVKMVGTKAIEIFNVAHGLPKQESPCTCTGCVEKMQSVARYLKENAKP